MISDPVSDLKSSDLMSGRTPVPQHRPSAMGQFTRPASLHTSSALQWGRLTNRAASRPASAFRLIYDAAYRPIAMSVYLLARRPMLPTARALDQLAIFIIVQLSSEHYAQNRVRPFNSHR